MNINTFKDYLEDIYCLLYDKPSLGSEKNVLIKFLNTNDNSLISDIIIITASNCYKINITCTNTIHKINYITIVNSNGITTLLNTFIPETTQSKLIDVILKSINSLNKNENNNDISTSLTTTGDIKYDLTNQGNGIVDTITNNIEVLKYATTNKDGKSYQNIIYSSLNTTTDFKVIDLPNKTFNSNNYKDFLYHSNIKDESKITDNGNAFTYNSGTVLAADNENNKINVSVEYSGDNEITVATEMLGRFYKVNAETGKEIRNSLAEKNHKIDKIEFSDDNNKYKMTLDSSLLNEGSANNIFNLITENETSNVGDQYICNIIETGNILTNGVEFKRNNSNNQYTLTVNELVEIEQEPIQE